jgi:hypothetical protein
MSGSAALASARRRRAIQPGNNEVSDIPKPPVSQSQPPPSPMPTNPGMLLMKHNQLLGTLQHDIEELKKQLLAKEKPVSDATSLEYYKTQHAILIEEMKDVKKTLLKVQTFAMETNLDIMKLKRLIQKEEMTIEIPDKLE